ncbi:MAG TPA: hypothetical protein VLM79_22995 [Kofleriaceae bacterium]|nr:hypothetical protein [Kofleriaceae bacterium]
MACHIEYSESVSSDEQLAFEAALQKAREDATTSKNGLEQEWFGIRGDVKLTEEQWFVRHYEEAGQSIGPHRRLEAVMDKLQGYDKVVNGTRWTVQLSGKEICKVTVFTPVGTPDIQVDHHRRIYRVRNKEYVLDDTGMPTRRYAFCVRQGQDGAPSLKPLVPRDKLFWTLTSTDVEWNTAMLEAYTAATGARDTWGALSAKAKVCLAYINYANNGKIGVCLAATAKRIRSNEGEGFVKATGHTVWKVDLAKIPSTTVLINIYARTPESEEWTAKRENRKNSKNGVWIAQGTVKNRELFCSAVPSTAVTHRLSDASLLEADNWNWKKEEFFKIL